MKKVCLIYVVKITIMNNYIIQFTVEVHFLDAAISFYIIKNENKNVHVSLVTS